MQRFTERHSGGFAYRLPEQKFMEQSSCYTPTALLQPYCSGPVVLVCAAAVPLFVTDETNYIKWNK